MSDCGICDGMRICKCKDDRRFMAAVAAMQAIIPDAEKVRSEVGDQLIADLAAKAAVLYADALIAELDKGE